MRKIAASLAAAAVIGVAGIAWGHFAMVIPSTDNVGKNDKKEISVGVQFTHPFEGGPQMQMDKPEKFGVVTGDKATDLLHTLKEKKVEGKSTWETTYKITRPGDYVFFVHPKPYWEPTEDKFIVHVTKVIVDAMGAQEGWDAPIAKIAGIPCEIVPLTRPYGLYQGNIFTGQVQRNGKPVPSVDVEVEWWGAGKTKAPTDSHLRQVVKTDADGRFSFALPKIGWWGFSAIMEDDKKIAHEGKEKKVEQAAVIWVKAYPMQ
ncbi:MAG: DUF4198 domain-containing protein [Thermodesulfobacteriota bacterium]